MERNTSKRIEQLIFYSTFVLNVVLFIARICLEFLFLNYQNVSHKIITWYDPKIMVPKWFYLNQMPEMGYSYNRVSQMTSIDLKINHSLLSSLNFCILTYSSLYIIIKYHIQILFFIFCWVSFTLNLAKVGHENSQMSKKIRRVFHYLVIDFINEKLWNFMVWLNLLPR